MNLSKRGMEHEFQARLILEIIGRPASNLTEALNAIADRLSKEKGVKLLERKVHPPVDVKDVKDLYTTFAELLIECDSMSTFFSIIFAYMPANIEIIKPDEITLRNSDITGMANKIIQRVHYYDAIARRLMVDNQNMKKQLGIEDKPASSAPVPAPAAKQSKSAKQKSTKPKSKKSKKK
jgi:hypothetical protein